MAASNEYIHKRLKSPRSIRVINLKGTSRGLFRRSIPDQPLEIELEEVSLDSFPSYEALSYTWDGQSLDQSIRCHGKTMKITRNCEVALLRLRTASKRRLWVDSICIDQTSTPEKSTQIPLMGDIYGRAKTVLVWLGDGSEAIEKSFQYLKDVNDILLPTMLQGNWVSEMAAGKQPSIPLDVEQEIMVRSLSFEEENKKMYGRNGTPESTMLKEIISRSWFTRMWTVQELVLGLNALIICGNSELSWSAFVCAMGFLAAIERKNKNSRATPWPSLEIYAKLRAPIHEQLSLSPLAQDMSIYQILIRTRHLSSGDPRDKLYGLFGYLTRLGVRNLPAVDYNLPVHQVYIDFTKFAIAHDQSLDILYDLGGTKSIQELPSWIPDWTQPYEGPRIDWNHKKVFAASKTSPVLFRFITNNEMHLSGIIVDKVKKRTDSGTEPVKKAGDTLKLDEILPNIIARIQAWQQWYFLAIEVDPYPAGEKLVSFILKIMLNNEVSEDDIEAFPLWANILMTYHPSNRKKEECLELVDEIVEWTLQRPAVWALYFSGGDDPIPVINTPEWRVITALADPGTPKQNQLHLRIFRQTMARTLFATENGYLGTTSNSLQVGDQIALISGMSLPMIIRQADDGTFALVAPAYVHGIMNGELWPDGGGDRLANLVFR